MTSSEFYCNSVSFFLLIITPGISTNVKLAKISLSANEPDNLFKKSLPNFVIESNGNVEIDWIVCPGKVWFCEPYEIIVYFSGDGSAMTSVPGNSFWHKNLINDVLPVDYGPITKHIGAASKSIFLTVD